MFINKVDNIIPGKLGKTDEFIKPGTTLLTDKPFVFVLKSKLRTEACDNCLERSKVLKCSGCQYVYYCDRDCQREAWSIHKSECGNLKRISPRILPDAARLMARIIVKLQKGGDHERAYYSENSFRKFKDLMSHYAEIKMEGKRLEHFTSLCGVLIEFLKDTVIPNSAELMGIYGRLCINAFNILDPEMISIGTGIYLAASIIDHSCDPNAVAVFKNTQIFIRNTKPMSSLNWSQVFISYIDLLNSPIERQEELLQAYYFSCKCAKCLEDQPNDIFIQSAACPNSSCDGPIQLRFDQSKKKTDFIEHCRKCNTKVSQTFIDKFINVTEFSREHIKTMQDTSIAYLDVCKLCLQKQKGVLHELNLLHVKTLDAATESSIDVGQWDDAKEFGVELIAGYKHYYGDQNPMLGLLYLKIGKILVYQNKSKEAMTYLQPAADILHVTHGMSHPLCRVQLDPLLKQAKLESKT